MAGRKFITKDMITAAREKGWNVTQAARHYGMHRTSISGACERFGIELSQSKFNPDMPSTRSKFWRDAVSKPKTRAAWSCSPEAIERTLQRIQREKRLQAME